MIYGAGFEVPSSGGGYIGFIPMHGSQQRHFHTTLVGSLHSESVVVFLLSMVACRGSWWLWRAFPCPGLSLQEVADAGVLPPVTSFSSSTSVI